MVLLKRQVLELIYPINSVFMTLETKNPNEILGFGVWTKITNKYIYAADQTIENNGGSDYVTTAMMPAHNHSFGLYTQGAGSHTHSITVHYSYDMDNDFGGGVWVPSNYGTGYNDGTVWSTSDPGNHTHYISGNTNTSASPTQKNLPKYQSFFIWYRTA